MDMEMEMDQETPKQEPTARPWTWQDFGRGPILTSCVSGRPIVMDFVRAGMQGAEPRFGKRTDNMGGIMVPLSQWDEMPPDARFMVRAVNNHDTLVEAATLALTELRAMRDNHQEWWDFNVTPQMCTAWDKLKSALADAQE